jgi:hypothetical protein
MDKETKIKKIRSVLRTFNREFAESYLDENLSNWRELEPEWQSITRLPPGSPGRWEWGTTPKDVTESFDEWRDRTGRSTLDLPDTQEVQDESEKKLPEKIDLSSKEVQTRIQDEIKQYLEEINASVDLYPEPESMEPSGQAFLETRKFSTSEKQIGLKKYPHLERLVKSLVVDIVRQGGGRQSYMPHEIEQVLSGLKSYYKESKQVTTEGTFDVNLVSPIGFHGGVRLIKEFLKSQGIVAQTGFSQQLRQILRYVTGGFETDSGPGWRGGKNPIVTSTLQEIPFLKELPNGLFVVKFKINEQDQTRSIVDASDIVPVYEKFMDIKPGADRTLPEQMQFIEDMRGTGTVRSMIDPSQQVKPLETQEQRDIFRHLVHEYSTEGDRRRQWEEIYDPDYDPVLLERIAKKAKERRTVTFQPDPELKEEEEEILEVPDIPPIPRKKPKPSGKPSATSPLAEQLRKRAAARLEVENEKARQKLGIKVEDVKEPEKVPAKKPDPKGGLKLPGGGPLFILDQLFQLVPGMGPVDEEGRPVAKLDEQMTKLTG